MMLITEDNLSNAAESALASGYQENAEFLLKGKGVDPEERDRYVFNAVAKGHVRVLQYFLKTGSISRDTWDSVWEMANRFEPGARKEQVLDLLRKATIRGLSLSE